MASPNGTTNKLLIGILSLLSTILLSGIPWAYSVHGRLTQIETTLNAMKEDRKTVGILWDKVLKLEYEVSMFTKKES